MRGFLRSFAVAALVACGGNANHGVDICSTTVPTPAACQTTCDPQPGAQNTCPAGFHCTPDGKCDAQCTPTGGQCGSGFICTSDGSCMDATACTGIACNVATCNGSGQSPTTFTGTVFAPNGTLPIFGVDVYVPNSDPGAFTDGVTCARCSDGLPGDPITQATTDEAGNFTLTGVPSGSNIPVVITIGKWRRQITIPTVADCTSTAITNADTTLPKSMTDLTPNSKSVDIPRIAISTGGADSMECLLPRLGIAEAEIGTAGGAQRIQLFSDLESGGKGVSKFDNGTAFADSAMLWDTTAHLGTYDIVILSCEGQQAGNTKPQAALDAMKGYADEGGRVFMSHWHNIWIEGDTQDGTNQSEAAWTAIANWSNGGDYGGNDTIDEINNPKGTSFATWMLNVMGSTVRDQIVLTSGTGKSTLTKINGMMAEQWVYTATGSATQNMQFETPVEGDPENACGKVVFSDMHVSGNSAGGTFPTTCGTSTTLSPQEKAIAFMFFDISTCVGQIF